MFQLSGFYSNVLFMRVCIGFSGLIWKLHKGSCTKRLELCLRVVSLLLFWPLYCGTRSGSTYVGLHMLGL